MEKRRSLRSLCAGLGLSLVLVMPMAHSTHSAHSTQLTQVAPRTNQLTNQLIVHLKHNDAWPSPSESDVANLLHTWSNASDTTLIYVRNMSDGSLVVRVIDDAATIAARLNQNTDALDIAYAEPDTFFQPDEVPNDPNFAEQWNLSDVPNNTYSIHLPNAWAVITGSERIIIAVLDTGALFNHPDLKHRLVPGYDFISDPTRANDGDGRDADATDSGNWVTQAEASNIAGDYYACHATSSAWHGTQMAGIIGAEANNNYGISGINWQSPLMPVRVLGKCGGHLSDLIDGLRWVGGLPVLDAPINLHPARVINLSLGAPDACSPALQSAIDEVTQRGAIVVVSAGNAAFNAIYQTPANCANILVVAGTDQHGERGYYSNYGNTVHISAPGGDPANAAVDRIVTTSNLGNTQAQTQTIGWVLGTSPAAAQVSGVVSLMLALRPTLSLRQIVWLLQHSATSFPTDGSCVRLGCGAGVLNAQSAVALTAQAPQLFSLFLPAVQTSASTVQNTIINGSFEDEQTGWTVSSVKGFPVIVGPAALPGELYVYDGEHVAWLGGVPGEVNAIEQRITVPAQGATLTFHAQVQSVEPSCSNDWATVQVNDVVIQKIGLCRSLNTNDWPAYNVDLSRYGNQSIALKLKVENNGSFSSNFFVDDVRLTAH